MDKKKYKVWIKRNPDAYDEIDAWDARDAAEKFCDKYFWEWELYEQGNYWDGEDSIIVEDNGCLHTFEIEIEPQPYFIVHEKGSEGGG